MFMEDLFAEWFEYIVTSKFQRGPTDRHFSHYRSMSDGQFLVSLREVITTENILGFRSILKAEEDYWLKDEDE